MRRRRRALLFGLALMLALPQAAPAATVTLSEEGGMRIAATAVGGCVARLEHSRRWRTLHYRNGCAQPLKTKVATFAALLAALATERPLAAEIDSIFLGRLVDYPELSARVALAIRASAGWDGAAARFRGAGGPNRGFAEALDRHGLLRPFIEALAPHGAAGGVASVEKVLIGPPRLGPAAEALLAAGVGAEERLPFDAQVWLQPRWREAP